MGVAEIITVVVFVTYVVAFALLRRELGASRISALAAIALIVAAAVAYGAGGEGVAAHIALYAFYLLAAAVLSALIWYVREGGKGSRRGARRRR